MSFSQKPKVRILIGSLTKENKGAIPTITKAIIEGLGDRYEYIPHYANRELGLTATASFNVFNVYYFVKHYVLWVLALLRYRPTIAHYPVTSYWNLEKSMFFLMTAKLLGAKPVGHLNGGSFDAFWSGLGPVRKRIGSWCLHNLDAFLVTGKRWRTWSCSMIGLKPERVIIIVNPIDITFETTALAFNHTGDTNVFFVGSLGKRKGVFDILAAASDLKHKGFCGHIHIAGPEDRTGDLRRIQEMISDKSLDNVKLLGPLYGDEKIGHFRRHGIFLFPSYNENFPLVVIEAAAAGKAIITTRVGSLPEFFEHERSVIYVEPGNTAEIVQALLRLHQDPDLRKSLGEGAREVFSTYLSSHQICAELDNAYEFILRV